MEFRFQISDYETELKIFIGFLLLFAVFANWGGGNAWSRYDLTQAIVEDQKVEISPYANNTNDIAIPIEELKENINLSGYQEKSPKEKRDVQKQLIQEAFQSPETSFYSDKAPMSSFLAIPGYVAGELILEKSTDSWIETGSRHLPLNLSTGTALNQFFVVLTVSAFFGALLLVLVYRYLLRHVDRKTSLYTVIVAGFATPLFTYSASYFGVINAAFFGFASFYSLEKFLEGDRKLWLFVSGILSGLAYSTEYYMALVPAALLVYQLVKGVRQKVLYFFSGSFIGSIPLFFYNWLITGNPLVTVQTSSNFFQPGPINSVCTVYTNCMTAYRLPGGFLVEPLRIINSGLRLLFFESRGLFFYSPVLLLSLPGIYYLYKRDRKLLLIAPGIFGALLLVQASHINWLGGVSFGPRYMVPGIPFLLIPLALTFQKIREYL
jgi:hypothetical protein